MAEIRTKLITDLPLAEVLGGFEILPVSQSGVAKKTSTLDIINYTKQQDYATWVYGASSNLLTTDLSTRYIKLYNEQPNQGAFPEFFIGEAGIHSVTGEVSGLSGFNFHYNETSDRFVFASYVSSISGNRNLTAYYIDPNAFMYITNLSTSNTLSARNIYVTDQITISANTNGDALYIVQSGQGNAIEVFDEINDLTPFVITASGNVGIKIANPVIDLTIAGSVSASQTLSARNINVLDRVGVSTSSPNERLTVLGNISASGIIYDERLNSNRWFETYTNYSAASANEARVATFVNENSSNIRNVNTTVNNTSANWNSVYSHWNVNSGLTFAARTYVNVNSANFSDSISRYNTASGTYATYQYVNNGFLPLSGGTVSSGVLRVSGETSFANNVTILGRLCAFNFTVINAETIPITASTLNVDGSGRFGGAFEVGGEVKFNDDLIVSGFVNVSSTIIADNTITSRQFVQDLNSNSREWGSVYNRWRQVSALDLDVRTFTNSNSSNIRNVNSTVNNTSANWNSNYSHWNTTSGLELNVRSFVNTNSSNISNVNSKVISTSSNWDQVYSSVIPSSANWNSNYSHWNRTSGLELNVRNFVNTNSSNLVNIQSVVLSTSANWNSAYSTWNSSSALELQVRNFVNSNSSDLVNIESVVLSTSANWNSNYSHWNSNSGLLFMTRNFVTSNSANTLQVDSTVNTTSARWNSNYSMFNQLSAPFGEAITDFQESSGRYNSVSTRVEFTSANWNSVYSTFQSNSGKYNSDRGVITIPLSGTTSVTVPNHTVGSMDIYLNGIKLIPTEDFTETSTSITLTEATKYNNYKLEYVVYGAYNVANAVARTGDVMTGSLTVPTLNVTTAFSLPTMFLSRQNISSEGGEIQFARASDGQSKYHIDVLGTGDNPDLRIFERTGPSAFTVRTTLKGSTGNLGINTTNPTGKLHVFQDTAGEPAARIQSGPDTTVDNLWVYNEGSGSAASITNTGAGAALWISQVGSGYSLVIADESIDGTPTVIDNAGNIGIGRVPDTNVKLDILGATSSPTPNPDIRLASTNGGGILITNNTGQSFWNPLTQQNDKSIIYYANGGLNTGGFTIGQFSDQNRGIRISPTGNVGISTATPNQRLTVVGNISSTGIIYGDGGGLKNLDLDRQFKQFREPRGMYTGGPTNWKMGSFLSQTGKLYLTGYAYNNITSLGTVGNAAYAYPNFTPAMIYGDGSDIPQNETIVKYYMGAREMFVYTDAGYMYGIGRNARGELGCGDQVQKGMWKRVSNLRYFDWFSPPNACAGYYLAPTYYYNDPYGFCLGIVNGRLYHWGAGAGWQSGRGASVSTGNVGATLSPTLVNVGALANKTNLVKCFAINDDYTEYGNGFVIDSNRDLFATGYNINGQLGLGDTVNRGQYVQVPNIKADNVGSILWNGNSTTFVLDEQLNRLYAAGYNAQGQLGIPTTTNARSTFQTIPGLEAGVKSFALGGTHSAMCAAIMMDGSLRTWGANDHGVLGHSGTTNTHIPTKPTNTFNTVFIKAAIAGAHLNLWAYTGYFLDNQGNIWSTGYNGHGQRGNGTLDSGGLINIMRKPSNVYFVDFSVGGFYSTAPSAQGGHFIHALDSDGNLWACGDGEQWQGGVGWPNQNLPTFRRCIIA